MFSTSPDRLFIKRHFWRIPRGGDAELLRLALTHPSFDSVNNYERMEFLGDSVWGLIVASFLYEHYPSLNEGKLTLLKAYLTNNAFISKLARRIGLGNFVRVGRAYKFPISESTLADVFESFVAFLYLTYGFERVKRWGYRVLKEVMPPDVDIDAIVSAFDPKGQLQAVASHMGKEVHYRVEQDGKAFRVTVYLNDEPVSEGVGFSVKEAEKNAARRALKVILSREEET